MIALLQRVTEARVESGGERLGVIGPGLVALIGVERGDRDAQAGRLAERVCAYRMFADAGGRMNLGLVQSGGALLAVSQFTLVADTDSGLRPSFTPAASPEEARRLFDVFVAACRARVGDVQTGRFGAAMRVSLVNDGPVTFSLRVAPQNGG